LLYEKLKDYDNAIADYTKAIEAGFDTDFPSHAGVANNKIAGVLTDKGLAAYNAKDNDTAFPLWLKAAEMGHMWAQSNVGVCYAQGWGTPADQEKAVYWYQKAADQGHGQSCFNLANNYMDGTGGLPADKEKAVEYYKKAVEAGYEKAKPKLEELAKELGIVMPEEEDAQADAEEEDAQSLGEEEFEKGEAAYKKKKYAEAVEWYLKSAEHGNVDAQFELFGIYKEGKGVKEDMNEAVKWLFKAVEQEDKYARESLCLSTSCLGEGAVSKDTEKKMIEWFKESAEQGYDYAQYALGGIYFYGRGVPEDEKEGMKWLEKAVEQGNELAIESLGRIRETHKKFGM
jgi:TPR repeat protein